MPQPRLGPRGAQPPPQRMRSCAQRYLAIRVLGGSSRESHWRARLCGRITAQMKRFIVERLLLGTLCTAGRIVYRALARQWSQSLPSTLPKTTLTRNLFNRAILATSFLPDLRDE